MNRSAPRRDRGQIGIVVLAMVVVGIVATQQLTHLCSVVIDSARAQSVADAVVLAAADVGPELASRVADRNRAAIVTIESVGESLEVVVDVNGVRARARASNSGQP